MLCANIEYKVNSKTDFYYFLFIICIFIYFLNNYKMNSCITKQKKSQQLTE